MFVEKEELKTVAYLYQIDEITDGDDTIIGIALDAAMEEVRSYLSHRYDMSAIFAKKGGQRNSFLVYIVKITALHQLVLLSNVDMLYDKIDGAYKQVIDFLEKVAEGKLNPAFPTLEETDNTATGLAGWGSDSKLSNNY